MRFDIIIIYHLYSFVNCFCLFFRDFLIFFPFFAIKAPPPPHIYTFLHSPFPEKKTGGNRRKKPSFLFVRKSRQNFFLRRFRKIFIFLVNSCRFMRKKDATGSRAAMKRHTSPSAGKRKEKPFPHRAREILRIHLHKYKITKKKSASAAQFFRNTSRALSEIVKSENGTRQSFTARKKTGGIPPVLTVLTVRPTKARIYSCTSTALMRRTPAEELCSLTILKVPSSPVDAA